MTALTPTRFAPPSVAEASAGMSPREEDTHRPRPVSPKLRDPRGGAKRSTTVAGTSVAGVEEETTERRRISMAQYLRELETVRQRHNRKEVRNSVLDVSSREVEGVMQLAAKLRGRYLAKLLDQAGGGGQPVSEASIRELARWREMYEEVEKGIEILKTAMEEGDVSVQGVIGR